MASSHWFFGAASLCILGLTIVLIFLVPPYLSFTDSNYDHFKIQALIKSYQEIQKENEELKLFITLNKCILDTIICDKKYFDEILKKKQIQNMI